jgi:hypothetical protein
MKRKLGFTLIEIMLGLIILIVLLTSVWRIFSAGNKNVTEVMANHSGNHAVELFIMKMTNEIREANMISEEYPKFVELSEVKNLTTNADDNRLEFTKIEYDFTKDPATLAPGEVNYIQKRIKYYVDSDDPDEWVLYKETEILDAEKKVVDSETTIFPVFDGIKHCIFYRLKDSSNSRTGSVYMDIEFARKDSPYSNYATMAAKERSACPEY